MFSLGTPTACRLPMISRIISGEEQQAGAPEGLILMPTTSVGSINLAHAARRERSPVSSFIPCSIMRPTTGCETRFRTMDFGSESSTTRPGNNPGIPSGDCLTCGNPCTSIGGGSGSVTFSCPGELGSNPRNKPALLKQLAFTNVRRSMVGSGQKNKRLSLRHRPSSLQLLFHHRDNRASTGYTCASHRHRGHFHYAEMDKDVSAGTPGDGNNVWDARLQIGRASCRERV